MKKVKLTCLLAFLSVGALSGCDALGTLKNAGQWVKDKATDILPWTKKDEKEEQKEQEVVATSIKSLSGVFESIAEGSTLEVSGLSATVVYAKNFFVY